MSNSPSDHFMGLNSCRLVQDLQDLAHRDRLAAVPHRHPREGLAPVERLERHRGRGRDLDDGRLPLEQAPRALLEEDEVIPTRRSTRRGTRSGAGPSDA